MRKIMSIFVAVALLIPMLSTVTEASFIIENKNPQTFTKEEFPSMLQDWVNWSLDGKEKTKCDFAYNNFHDKYCYYISNLDIDIKGKEFNFNQKVKILEKGYVLLPGSAEIFPSKVLVDGKETNIISKAGRPYVYLDKGKYNISGYAISKEDIRYLFIPNNSTIVKVKKDNKDIPNPTIDYQGVIRLETISTTKSETDDISIFVYRKITDSIPMDMTVRLNLNVTGKERVENLGKIIPSNFLLSSINSSLSVYVQKNGDLIAEVKPGSSTIDIVLRQEKESLSFVLDNTPVDQEVWVFESDKSRRVIQPPLTLHSVQTQNIPMPHHWKHLSAYEINKEDSFTLEVKKYDNKNLDELSLNRNIKLSFDGKFYSIQDNITANFKEDGRITLDAPFNFYSASINNEPQAITQTSENKTPGIEVRKGYSSIVNVLRVDNEKEIPSTGYNREFSNVNWNLELAPGYKLFHAVGVDSVSDSWIESWDLMNVFMVSLLVVCLYYLFGVKKAFIGLVLIVLLHPIFPRFTYISFALCGLLFLQRNIKQELLAYKFIAYIRYTMFFFLTLAAFMFVIKHLRGAIYPSLDVYYDSIYFNLLDADFLVVFYAYSFVGYILYKIFSNKNYKVGKKVFYTFGVFFITVVSTAIITAIVNGMYLIGASPVMYRDAYPPAQAYGSGAVYKSYNNYAVSEEMEMLSVADANFEYRDRKEVSKMAISGNVGKLKNANLNQRLLADASMKKYQSINVARNIAQTGVGFPNWSGNSSSIRMFLKGPVTLDDSFKLYLMSPCMNIFLAFLRVGLLILMMLWLFDGKRTKPNLGEKGKNIMKKIFTACVLTMLFVSPNVAKASSDVIPPSEVIKKMEERLTRDYVPSCLPECVSIPDGSISNIDDVVKIRINYHSNEKLVVPLPVLRADGSGYAKLDNIKVNGNEALESLKKGDSTFVLINKGINVIEITYTLDENTDRFILSSNVKINNLENKLEGLSFSENKSGYQTFQINRVKKVTSVKVTPENAKMNIDTFFVVKRTFDIGAMWEVTTEVVRVNNLSEAATIEVPLLNGEKVIDTDGTLTSGKLRVSFSPSQTVKTYSSLLPVEQDIVLDAPEKIITYKEEWVFNVDHSWSFKYSGLTPTVNSGNNITFKPNAGEKLDFEIFRPTSIDGYVVTIDYVTYEMSYGRGVVETAMTLNMRASDAGVHDIKIPDNAEVKELKVGGIQYPITVNGNKLTVPISQGNNNIYFKTSIKSEISTLVEFPKFDLNAPAVNINQIAKIPLNRWVLFTCGTAKGPAVLFWSMIPAWLIIAFVLSRFKAAPVSFLQWFILLLGLTQTNLTFMVFIVMWFIAFGIRDRFSEGLKFKKLFQLMLPVLTMFFLYSLFNGVVSGLLGTWTMRITGNTSVYSEIIQFTWYQDAVFGELPSPKVISLPVWVYRCFMVLWSTWLAIMFVKWIKWGFSAYMKDSAWNNK